MRARHKFYRIYQKNAMRISESKQNCHCYELIQMEEMSSSFTNCLLLKLSWELNIEIQNQIHGVWTMIQPLVMNSTFYFGSINCFCYVNQFIIP